jgi:4'-phosphopantetheinyl transferase
LIVWPTQGAAEPLGDSSVHIWVASLDASRERLARLSNTLSEDERHRALRFGRASLTARFIAGRGQLREVLGAYLGLPATDIGFAYSKNGKPRIARPQSHPALHFNVAHSDTVALYAVSRISCLGVDVEEVRPFEGMPAIARQHFSAAERQRLDAEPAESYVAAFFRCWTRKEAYVKAIGTGLSTPLDSFDVSLAAGERTALLRVNGDDDAPHRWALVHLEPVRGCVGALAVETPHPSVCCWRWL